ncbi:MAG: glycerate kinase [Proteobacteria bacterium]|nr:glycerate kinase [Pseudomonadota bacterium]NDC23478.1 glycerate kinase [Pseudomonadota bacterium]NDD04026.1 glycerate kinase [Pseudomonadota bacterium]NDG28023.1 glycerate kinase [Pseudomonadota bacterium]
MKTPTLFLVSFANFKGTLTNEEACKNAAQALEALGQHTLQIPLGDGGKGTFSFLKKQSGAEKRIHAVTGAFGDARQAQSWWKKSAIGSWQIFFESTEVVGYSPAQPNRKDAVGATSRGMGEWLQHLSDEIKDAPCELFIGLGDSAISDAGKGMLDVLKTPFWKNWRITVLCDVENPLCGPRGSARVFSPQKGASAEDVAVLEKAHWDFAQEIKQQTGRDISQMPRGGSAGGLATALHVFLGGELVPGAQWMLKHSGFYEALTRCDCLITGEGRSDAQTRSGKAPWAALKAAEALNKPSFLISGSFGEGKDHLVTKSLVKKEECGREPTPPEALKTAITQLVGHWAPG